MTQAFVCYDRKSQPRVQELAGALKRNNIVAWWDQDAKSSVDWSQEILANLAASEVVLVFLGEDELQTTTLTELGAARALNKPIVLAKEAGRLDATAVPFIDVVIQRKTLIEIARTLRELINYREDKKAHRVQTDSASRAFLDVSAIRAHVPYLRHFARVLLGNQEAADFAVATTFGRILADPFAFNPRGLQSRLAVYSLLLSVVRRARPPVLTPHLENSVEELAVILVCVAGFESSETAQILDISESKVDDLVSQADSRESYRIAERVLIIEDEPLTALDFERILKDLGHSVCKIARTRDQAIAAAIKVKPDLIIADVMLADGSSGDEAVEEILTHASMPVIFVTAYPPRLLRGNKREPVFLIAKPFHPLQVKAVVNQAMKLADLAS